MKLIFEKGKQNYIKKNEPVGALHNKSLFCIITGMACIWIGVGSVIPNSFKLLIIPCGNPLIPLKCTKGSGILSPQTNMRFNLRKCAT